MKEDYLKEITGKVDPDMSREAMVGYMTDYPDFMKNSFKCLEGFRGDTLQSCGWTFGSSNKFLVTFNPNLRSYSKLFTTEEMKIIDSFRFGYHCRANFAVIPQELNLWRGAFAEGLNDNYGRGQCDYFDIYLNLIRSYYMKLGLPRNARKKILQNKDWLDWFGSGEAGWHDFVYYYRFNPYVNSSYEVKDLFATPCTYQEKECKELVGVYHGWNYCLPLCSSDGRDVSLMIGKQRALNFASNSLWIWQERSAALAINKTA